MFTLALISTDVKGQKNESINNEFVVAEDLKFCNCTRIPLQQPNKKKTKLLLTLQVMTQVVNIHFSTEL